MGPNPFDVDDLMEYLIVTEQVDENFALKEDSDDKKEKDDTDYSKTIGRWNKK
jgi:hypothetical protein